MSMYSEKREKNRMRVADDIIFCSELMSRLQNAVVQNTHWKKEQVRADILRLRRELNNLRLFMDEHRWQL